MFVAAWFGGLFSLFVLCLVMRPPVAPAEEPMVGGAERQLVDRAITVYVDATSSTWRSRGRVSFQVVPSVRMKLQSAGFAVVQNQTDPHDLTLKVEYREERGSQFGIDLYATDISLVASLEHPTDCQLLGLQPHEITGMNES